MCKTYIHVSKITFIFRKTNAVSVLLLNYVNYLNKCNEFLS